MSQLTYSYIRTILFLLGFSVSFVYAQEKFKGNYEVLFASGNRTFEPNLADFLAEPNLAASDYVRGYTYVYLQFEHIPTQAERDRIDATGILLLEYIPHKVYIAAIPEAFDWQLLHDWEVRTVMKISANNKLASSVLGPYYEDWADFGDQVEVLVQYHKNLSDDVVRPLLIEAGFVPSHREKTHVYIRGKVAKSSLYELASLPYINRIELAPPPPEPTSREGRTLHRSYAINNQLAGGYRYDGTGVNVGVNDDGYIGPHIDFQGRLDQSAVGSMISGNHGDMVAGIVAGAGNIDPTITGMAPGAFLYIEQYIGILAHTVPRHQNDDVMIFSTSYTSGCNEYSPLTVQVDQEIHQNPSLIQVFSGGNSSSMDCGYGAGAGWGNLRGGYNMGKNVIAAANVLRDGDRAGSSSRGPANDGRIKPDIAAHGNYQLSTDEDNGYLTGSGTSAAAPSIAGVLAQLYHAYRELNGGANPNSGLIKASLLNTAQDRGNVGPDFEYGWGIVNAYRALKTLEDQTYWNGTVSQGGQISQTLTIPAGVKEARIMLYWMDPQGAAMASSALVNDLDLTVTNGGNFFYPWILDHTPNPINLSTPATNGVDNLNNMEQVSLTNPTSGTYDIVVNGSVVPQGPQEYFIIYEFIYDEIALMYPLGGEGLVPGEQEVIHWDAYGNTASFTLEYSLNGGNTWNTLTTVAGTERLYDWTVPNVQTGQALIRVSRNGLSDQSTSTFSITAPPTNLAIIAICPTSLSFTWDAVPGATAYDVFYLGNHYMDSIATTTATSFSVPIAHADDHHWVSVRAVGANGLRSRRALAISDTSGLRNCNTPNDVQVYTVNSPFGNLCLGSASPSVEVTLANLAAVPLSNIPVSYQLSGGNVVTEMFTGTIPGNGGTATFTFSTPLSVVGSGEFELISWTSLNGDAFSSNDSASRSLLIRPLIDTYPYTEDFSTGANGWTIGGVNASWELGTPIGSIINSASSVPNSWATNLNGNYNLSEDSWVLGPCFDFSSLTDPQIRMNIWWEIETGWDGAVLQSSIDNGTTWQNVGSLNDPNNWFNRTGIAASPGGQATGWSGEGSFASGGWVTASNALSGLAGQSSVWLRIAFASDNIITTAGFAFDDIVIGDPQDVLDLATTHFVSPSNIGCGSPSSTVSIAVQNVGTLPISHINAGFSVNGGSYTVESFAVSLTPGATDTLTFTATSSLIAGAMLEIYASAVADTNTLNDSLATLIASNPIVTSFPYVEDFEDGGILDALWRQGTDEDQDWTVLSGATPSIGTGPATDHTTGTTSGYYVYTEDSGEEHFPVDLYSPCLDLSAMTSPMMAFWYHSNEISGGSFPNELWVQISDGSGWVSVDTIGHVNNNWNYWSMNLNAYIGQTIQVRFRSRTDNDDYSHDIAIDDFSVLEPSATDIELTDILLADTTICADAFQMIDLALTNMGATPQTAFTLSIGLSGATSGSYNFSWNGNLQSNETQTFTVGPIDMSTPGTYTIQGTATLAGDLNTSNNTASSTVMVSPASSSPLISHAIVCDTGEAVTLEATGNGAISWYDSPTSLAPIATGNTFSPAPITGTTTFYVEQSGMPSVVGPPDSDIGNKGHYVNYSDGLVFDVLGTSSIVIDSVTCYVGSSGNLVVNIRDNNGNTIASSLYIVSSSMAASNGGEVRVPLNFSIPPGSDYQMNASGTNIGGLIRNSSGATYPYTDLSGLVSITSAINNLPAAYYFFYDWQVSVEGCPSERLPVEAYLARDVFEPNDVLPAILPSMGTNRNAYICDVADIDLFEVMVNIAKPNLRISLSGETDMMEIRLMNANMNVLATASNANEDIELVMNSLNAGTYIIEVKGSAAYVGSDGYNLRAQYSDQPFSIRTHIDMSSFDKSFVLYPNPNTGMFYMDFLADTSVDLDIRVVDMYGKAIFRKHSRTQIGENHLSLDLGEVAVGLYFIELQLDGKKMVKRIQVNH